MKASYNWLKEFVDIKAQPKDLAHALTMAGFEVEAIEEHEGDFVYDIGITPNRPDCLSITGISREISARYKIPFKNKVTAIRSGKGKGPEVEIVNPELCHRYCSRVISGVRPGPSPAWLVKRLEACGFRSTSNIVDVTNYILLETGQPLHAFDFNSLSGGKIIVRKAGPTNTFTTLDNEKRQIDGDMLLIWDADKPVAVAGVMGGRNSEVTGSTVDILLESAYFSPSSVRRTARRLNISTESSYRFERNVDINNVPEALDRAAGMIVELAGGVVTEMTDRYPVPHESRSLPVSFAKINSVIGVDIDQAFVKETLMNLGFALKDQQGKGQHKAEGVIVTPPGFRSDVERDIDIVEEIARIYGYDRIPSAFPVMQMFPVRRNRKLDLICLLKFKLAASGCSEAINFSFLNPDDLDRLQLARDDRRRRLMHIRNPLRREEPALRTTLVPALLNNTSMNLNRGEKDMRLFEISRIFLPSKEKLPDEVTQLAAVCCKGKTASLWGGSHEGFYDLKGIIENIFGALKIKNISFSPEAAAPEPYLHPAKSCSISIDGQTVGSIGVIHPLVSEAFDVSGDISIVELSDLEHILKAIPLKTEYSSLPRYPYVERDIAVIVEKDTTAAQVREEILGAGNHLIESVALFDIYSGKSIPPDKKSLAFTIRFRSPDRTLTDREVDEVHTRIVRALSDRLNAELR